MKIPIGVNILNNPKMRKTLFYPILYMCICVIYYICAFMWTIEKHPQKNTKIVFFIILP